MPRLTNSLKNRTPLVSQIPENQLKHSHTYSTLLNRMYGFFNHLKRNIRIRRCFQKLTENNVSHYNRTQSIGLHILKNSDDILKGPILPTLKHLRQITLVKKLKSRNFHHIRIHRMSFAFTFHLFVTSYFYFLFFFYFN